MVNATHIFSINTYMKYATIPSTLIIVILVILQRRSRLNRCGYYHPALVVPMRFLDGYNDRWAYALSFGAIASILVNMFQQISFDPGQNDQDITLASDTMFCGASDNPNSTQSILCNKIWVQTLVLQSQSLVASLVCAPHFICISTPYKLIGAIMGLGYSIYWIVFYIVGDVMIQRDNDRTLGTLMIVRDIPVILCFFGLCLRSLWTIYKCYVNKTIRVRVVDNVVERHQVDHVVSMLRPAPEDPIPPEGLVQKIKVKIKGQLFPHFKLPTRIICIAFVQVIVIYYMGAFFSEIGVSFRRLLIRFLPTFVTGSDELKEIIDIFDGVYVMAEVISLLSSAIYITLFVVNYRINMINIYKGKKHTLYQDAESRSSSMHVASSLRLPGYQIAYILWGFIIIFAVLLLVIAIISFGIYFLKNLGIVTDVLMSIAQTLSVPILTMAVFYVQVLLVRQFLLQPKINKDDKSPPLNVDNRHVYEVMAYALVFSNVVVGVASALFRTMKSFLLGVVFLGRLDRCLLMKGFESLDPGYMAYVGMLLVDNAHNNPLMRTFCAVLFRLTCRRDDKITKGISHLPEPDKTCSNSRAARRWHLAYTLLKNPDLLSRRKLVLLLTNSLENDNVDSSDNDRPSRNASSTTGNRFRVPTDCRSGAYDDEVDFQPASRKVLHLGDRELPKVVAEGYDASAAEVGSRRQKRADSFVV